MRIDRFGVGESIRIARGDKRPNDSASTLLTDGTGMFKGERTDLYKAFNCAQLVERLKVLRRGGWVDRI